MQSVNVNDLIADLKVLTGQTDICGIVIYDTTSVAGNSWDIIDSSLAGTYEQHDISDATYTIAYFLPYTSTNVLSINLNNPTSPCSDYYEYYIIPSAAMEYFTSPRVNINNVSDYINIRVYYRNYEKYMIVPIPGNIEQFLTNRIQFYTTSTLPIVNSYTPIQVNSVFDTKDMGYRVIQNASEQTIAAEVKTYLSTNNALPTFKNYRDYMAYKKAINLQNSLLYRYGA